MSKKDIAMQKYGIDRKRYRELMYFCMQYPDWKREIEYGLHSVAQDGQPHGTSVGQPVEIQAERNVELQDKIHQIDTAAYDADNTLSRYIIQSVTEGISYDYMMPPCGRRQFYEARRKFFFILSKKR